jgi:hypothetical protein
MGSEPVGPLSSAELRQHVSDGRLTPGGYVRKGNDGRWVSANSVRGLFEQVPESSSPSQQDAAQHQPRATTTPIKTLKSGVLPGSFVYAAIGIGVAFTISVVGFAFVVAGQSLGAQTLDTEYARRADEERTLKLKHE